jgi:phage pi2 protein 07
MNEPEKLLLKNIVLDNGVNEYDINQICLEENQEIYTFTCKQISFKIHAWYSDIIDKVNLEDATLVIKTNTDYEKSDFSLKNASTILNQEFQEIFQNGIAKSNL